MASRLYSRTKEHGDGTQQLPHASVKQEVATGAPGSRQKLTDGESLPACTIQANYRIATRSISQITLKFVWKLKISKNKSCSKFKVLQLCFNNHTQILSRFENASLKPKGDTLRIYPLSNYFKFYITTLKTLKINFVHIDKLYTFPFRLNPKMCLDFELGFPGQNLNTRNQGFEIPI